MMQVENEVGLLGDSRDRSEAANKAFAGPVPKELLDYIASHKDTLHPHAPQGVGSGRVQDIRDLGRGFRQRRVHG